MAEQKKLDLVELSPQEYPPVCKILNYNHYIFKINKRLAEDRKKAKKTQVKEIRIRHCTDIGDYRVKINNASRFIEQGHKVKVTLTYRGRERSHAELGVRMIERVTNDLQEIGDVEHEPKASGRQIYTTIVPKRKKNK